MRAPHILIVAFAAAAGFLAGRLSSPKPQRQAPVMTIQSGPVIQRADTLSYLTATFDRAADKDHSLMTAHLWPGHYARIIVKNSNIPQNAAPVRLRADIPLSVQNITPEDTIIVAASDNVTGPIAARVIKTRDGDTFEAEVVLADNTALITHIRIKGIDTPEKGGRAKCAEEAKKGDAATAFAKTLLDGQTVLLKNIDFDKYGDRYVADVALTNGTNIADALIKKGLAKPYDGGTKSSWCGTGR